MNFVSSKETVPSRVSEMPSLERLPKPSNPPLTVPSSFWLICRTEKSPVSAAAEDLLAEVLYAVCLLISENAPFIASTIDFTFAVIAEVSEATSTLTPVSPSLVTVIEVPVMRLPNVLLVLVTA